MSVINSVQQILNDGDALEAAFIRACLFQEYYEYITYTVVWFFMILLNFMDQILAYQAVYSNLGWLIEMTSSTYQIVDRIQAALVFEILQELNAPDYDDNATKETIIRINTRLPIFYLHWGYNLTTEHRLLLHSSTGEDQPAYFVDGKTSITSSTDQIMSSFHANYPLVVANYDVLPCIVSARVFDESINQYSLVLYRRRPEDSAMKRVRNIFIPFRLWREADVRLYTNCDCELEVTELELSTFFERVGLLATIRNDMQAEAKAEAVDLLNENVGFGH